MLNVKTDPRTAVVRWLISRPKRCLKFTGGKRTTAKKFVGVHRTLKKGEPNLGLGKKKKGWKPAGVGWHQKRRSASPCLKKGELNTLRVKWGGGKSMQETPHDPSGKRCVFISGEEGGRNRGVLT